MILIYCYESSIGNININPSNNDSGFMLVINAICYGVYDSPYDAVRDVIDHSTGCYDWDRLDYKLSPPFDLSKWSHL